MVRNIVSNGGKLKNFAKFRILTDSHRRNTCERLFFKIKFSSGLLFLKDSIDREKTSQYNLTIQARDLAIPAQKASRIFTVNIVDINDNPVEFVGPFDQSGSTLEANVSENLPADTYVTTVSYSSHKRY